MTRYQIALRHKPVKPVSLPASVLKLSKTKSKPPYHATYPQTQTLPYQSTGIDPRYLPSLARYAGEIDPRYLPHTVTGQQQAPIRLTEEEIDRRMRRCFMQFEGNPDELLPGYEIDHNTNTDSIVIRWRYYDQTRSMSIPREVFIQRHQIRGI